AALAQASAIREGAIFDLIGYHAATARERRSEWQPVLLIRNPAPRVRSGVAIIDVEEVLADVPVGPGSANAAPVRPARPSRKASVPTLGVMQVLSQEVRFSRIESPQHYPDNDLVAVRRVAAWVSGAPAYGIATYAIGEPDSRQKPRSEHLVTVSSDSMENG